MATVLTPNRVWARRASDEQITRTTGEGSGSDAQSVRRLTPVRVLLTRSAAAMNS